MTAAPPFWRLHIHEALPSTSDACRASAEAGEAEGLAILAHQQTAGRGTHGRAWSSPVGNLYLSLLLRPPGRIDQAPQWGLLTAVALVETLAPLLPAGSRPRLKWPNDVLLDGAKLAGVLAEAAADPQGRLAWLVIGIGANLRVAPIVPDRPTARIGDSAPAPEDFAALLLARLAVWRNTVMTEGFAPMRAAWLEHGPAIGAPLQVRQGSHVQQGRFAGLAGDGALLLGTQAGVKVIVAGET